MYKQPRHQNRLEFPGLGRTARQINSLRAPGHHQFALSLVYPRVLSLDSLPILKHRLHTSLRFRQQIRRIGFDHEIWLVRLTYISVVKTNKGNDMERICWVNAFPSQGTSVYDLHCAACEGSRS